MLRRRYRDHMANVRSHPVARPFRAGTACWQASLGGPATGPVSCTGFVRADLGRGAWLDRGDAWAPDPDELFAVLADAAPWRARTVTMYGNLLDEPRLVAEFDGADDRRLPPRVSELAAALADHYGRRFDVVTAALYRDGRDSVAWHGDRIARHIDEPVVAVVSLGAPRRFLLRPLGGGASLAFTPRGGDVFVMGGSCQRTWQHSVPKCRAAGPRISLMFRDVIQ